MGKVAIFATWVIYEVQDMYFKSQILYQTLISMRIYMLAENLYTTFHIF